MPHQEFPSQSLSHEEKIRRLVESGEAVDAEDAEAALQEEADAEFLRTTNRSEYLAKLDEVLQNTETGPEVRWDANFQKAVVTTGEIPDELEYLAYQMMRDLPFGTPVDENARRHQKNIKLRLERKAEILAVRIGKDRAEDLFQRYRQKLQELFDNY